MRAPSKIFVLGYGRSGTTMMGRILGNHPQVYMFRELNFFEKLWDRKHEQELTGEEASDLAANLLSINQHGYGMKRDFSEFKNEAQEIINRTARKTLTPIQVYESFLTYLPEKMGKRIPCEQTPGYVFYLPEILELFPEARIINMVRDPRDVLVSRKKKWRQYALKPEPIPFNRTLRTWAHYHPVSSSYLWKSAVKAAQPFVESGQVLQVRFEDVLQAPEETLRKICDFIGISYEERMLEVPLYGSSFIKSSTEKVGIDRSRTSNWKHGGLNSAELYINQILTADVMKSLQYEPVKVFPNPFLLLFYYLVLPFRMGLTFVLHKKHFKNMKESLRKRLR